LGAGLAGGVTTSLGGAPSRARLSGDGTLAATTVFVTGHSYFQVGFSTETKIYDRATGRSVGNLEKDFTTYIGGQPVHPAGLNVWGGTVGPGPRPNMFYATVATGGHTWLARGDLAAKTLTALRTDAECPSLSPDGKTIVYKKRNGSRIAWRLNAYDVATGTE